MDAAAPSRSLPARLLRLFASLAFLMVLTIGLLFFSIWLDHRRSTTLPAPTGRFAVGRVIYDWVDSRALDPLAPAPGTHRELLVWIWYPAAPGTSAVADEYLPAATRNAVARQLGALRFLTRDRAEVRSHALRDAAVSPAQATYPVVLLRAGASLEVWNYTSLAEDLASHGFVVVGFDAPFRSHVVVFPGGREAHRLPQNNPELCLEQSGAARDQCATKLLTAWTSDMSFALDRLQQLNASDPSGKFTGHLDLSRVGAFGHSFGGAAALQFCQVDPRCKAGVDIDGAPHGPVIQAGVQHPFMILLSDHSRESGPEKEQIGADLRSVYDHLPTNTRTYVMIRGANHFLFSDDAVVRSHVLLGALRLFGLIGIDPPRQLAVTSYCLRTFFDAYLQKGSDSPLNLASGLYPELQAQ